MRENAPRAIGQGAQGRERERLTRRAIIRAKVVAVCLWASWCAAIWTATR